MVSRSVSIFWAPAALLCAISGAAAQQLPAVSTVNAKLEFDAGVLSVPGPMFMARAAGTLTVPAGDRFGVQIDVSAASAPGFTGSAAVHGFTRDPASYLVGGTLGVIRTPGATVLAAGPEAELYLDRWTLEAWAGLSYARPNAGPDRVAPMVMANLGYYLDDDTRLTVGLSSLDGYGAIQFGGEHLFADFELPVAVTAETRIGQDGAWRGMLGLRAYLGPPDKTLIRRHREDDPADRGGALYTAAGGKTIGGAKAPGAHATVQDPPADAPDPNPDEGPVDDPGQDDSPCYIHVGGPPVPCEQPESK